MSNYFSHFPSVSYDISKTGDFHSVVDILRRFTITSTLSKRASIYYDYTIRDGDRPDTIAHKYYGDSKYDWVVLVTNTIVDPNYDWPLTHANFKSFINDKYGSMSAAQQTTHHYEQIIRQESTSAFGVHLPEITISVDVTTYNTLSTADRKLVDVYTYEQELNETKRTIRILDKKHLGTLLTQAERIFN